ncbi:MAG: FAD-dependent oxidoreductase [Eubacteriales bacterium]|nr:FAD-dependent oxidoreductase [Eubacteriales bacterium]
MEQQNYWLHGVQRIHPILRGRRSADAVVVGGGVSGLTIALWLSRAGLKVVVLEAETLGSGATSRCAGMVSLSGGLSYRLLEERRGKTVAAAYGQTQQNAFHALRELSAELGARSDWLDVDAYTVGQREEELLKEAEAMRRAGIAAQTSKAAQSPMPAEYALCIKNMATLDPMKHLRYLATAGEALGIGIFEHSRVTALETNLAYTERGSVLAPYIIIATGYPIVNTPGWYFLRLIQRKAGLFPLGEPAKFDGMYFGNAYGLRKTKEGALLRLSGEQTGSGEENDLTTRFQSRYAPLLGAAQMERAVEGIETYSADGLPYIGPYSKKTPNLFVASGYGGRGLMGSMVAAQAITAKVLGLSGDGYEIYSGQRQGKGVQAAQLKACFGMGARYMKSMLHFTAPRCPHMGCKLVYRAKERLWECPCHGSRFDDIGHVMNAPAIRDAVIQHRKRG